MRVCADHYVTRYYQSFFRQKGMLNADVAPDFDGKPNAADASAILRYMVGLIKQFEIEEQN